MTVSYRGDSVLQWRQCLTVVTVS